MKRHFSRWPFPTQCVRVHVWWWGESCDQICLHHMKSQSASPLQSKSHMRSNRNRYFLRPSNGVACSCGIALILVVESAIPWRWVHLPAQLQMCRLVAVTSSNTTPWLREPSVVCSSDFWPSDPSAVPSANALLEALSDSSYLRRIRSLSASLLESKSYMMCPKGTSTSDEDTMICTRSRPRIISFPGIPSETCDAMPECNTPYLETSHRSCQNATIGFGGPAKAAHWLTTPGYSFGPTEQNERSHLLDRDRVAFMLRHFHQRALTRRR
jgi:hypothetical protein